MISDRQTDRRTDKRTDIRPRKNNMFPDPKGGRHNTSINNLKNVNLPFLQGIRFNIFSACTNDYLSHLKKQRSL